MKSFNYNLRVAEIFSGSQSLRKAFENSGHIVTSLDIQKYRNTAANTIIMDFLDFDYSYFDPGYFDILFFGLPCQAFSKASGNFHFDSQWRPKTEFAEKSMLLFEKVTQLTEYFVNAIFYIENPSGGLSNYPPMQDFLRSNNYFMHRLHLGSFGFPTLKQTDIFTNNQVLPILPKLYRKNGVYSKNKFDNLSSNQRHTYPPAFCDFIVRYSLQGYISNFNTNLLQNL